MRKDACLQILGIQIKRINNNANIGDTQEEACKFIFCYSKITEWVTIKRKRNKFLRFLESEQPEVQTPASGKWGGGEHHPEIRLCLSVFVILAQTIVTWE